MMPVSVHVYLFSVIAVWQLIGSASCQDGLRVTLRGREIPNHGLLATQEIGGNQTNLAEGLACVYPVGRSADWIRADGFTVESNPAHLFSIRRSGNTVYLFRNPSRMASVFQTFGNGIWQCASNGTEQIIFIGIYNEANEGIISRGTPGDIQLSLVGDDPLRFNLTFNTTGGPASYVTWTRDGVNISSLADNRFVTSQTVGHVQHVFETLLLEDYRAGNYSNTLAVTGRLPGVYRVNVTNDRTTEAVTPTGTQFTVLDFFHSNVSVSRSEDLRSIIVSWNLNRNALNSINAYSIKYMICSPNSCGSENTLNITDLSTTQYTLSDVTLWTIYRIRVFPLSDPPTSSTYILPGVYSIEIRGVSSPAITSVSELANITSVRVTWEQPEGGLTVDEYVVSYRRLNGTNGQCESFQDGNTVAFRGDSRISAATFSMTLHLRAYSIYVVNIVGRRATLFNSSDFIQVNTNTSVPSEAPLNLVITNSASRSADVTWDSVECIHRNGFITHYIISYGPESGPVKNVTVNISEPNDGGRYTATGLDPAVSYVFKVAAVNDAGVGVFAAVTIEGNNNNIAIIAGVVTVVLVLILVVVVVGAIFIAFRCFRAKRLEAVYKPNQVIYEEPYYPPPTEQMKMETCPAYDVSNVKQS